MLARDISERRPHGPHQLLTYSRRIHVTAHCVVDGRQIGTRLPALALADPFDKARISLLQVALSIEICIVDCQSRKITRMRNVQRSSFAIFLLVIAIPPLVHATELQPKTKAAFDKYIQL